MKRLLICLWFVLLLGLLLPRLGAAPVRAQDAPETPTSESPAPDQPALEPSSPLPQAPLYTLTGITERISLAPGGGEPSEHASQPRISADGRYVAFESAAPELVAGDTNLLTDIFVFDREAGLMQRVSVSSGGEQANGASSLADMTPDGRFVAFTTSATNLVRAVDSAPVDTNGVEDAYVHDRLTGVTERVSLSSSELQGRRQSLSSAISADGRFVVFESDADNLIAADSNERRDVFVRDRTRGATERVSVTNNESQANNRSFDADISADGRYVVFASDATNLVGSQDTNGAPDIYRRDRSSGITLRVSVDDDEAQANNRSLSPAVSASGRYVVFNSDAANLTENDFNTTQDVFLRDVSAGTTRRVSVTSDGAEADGASAWPSISSDGRWVSFTSVSDGLVNGDDNLHADIFLYDTQTALLERVSLSSMGGQGRLNSGASAVSAGGRFVAFDSASSFTAGDSNRKFDVFVRDRESRLLITILPYVTFE